MNLEKKTFHQKTISFILFDASWPKLFLFSPKMIFFYLNEFFFMKREIIFSFLSCPLQNYKVIFTEISECIIIIIFAHCKCRFTCNKLASHTAENGPGFKSKHLNFFFGKNICSIIICSLLSYNLNFQKMPPRE